MTFAFGRGTLSLVLRRRESWQLDLGRSDLFCDVLGPSRRIFRSPAFGFGAHGSESSGALANSPVSWCQLASEKLGGFSLRQYTVA